MVSGCGLVCLDVAEVTTLCLETGGNDVWTGLQSVTIVTLARTEICLEPCLGRFSYGLVRHGHQFPDKVPRLGWLALPKSVLESCVQMVYV